MSKTSWIRPEVILFPYLRKLQVPTLIVHGNQDLIPAYTAAQEIKDAIPNSKIIYLDHCGHFPYIETPDDLFKSIRLF
ncbi:MAG: alpha/beta hydrolase [Candidatus Rickettsia vulgarisii]